MANLPIPTLATEAPGRWNTAALWRANVYNPAIFSLNPPLFVGTQSLAQSVPFGSGWTSISLDTAQVDTYTGHSNSLNNSRFSAPVPGWYDVCGVVCWTSNGTGIRASRLAVNGTSVSGSAQSWAAAASGTTAVPTAVRSVFLNTGQYVEVQAFQTSGAALSTRVASESASALWVCWSHA